MYDKVTKDSLGFYRIKVLPSKQELTEYYGKKYYQQDEHYQHTYSTEELTYITNKIAQKYHEIMKFVPANTPLRMLDIGCGEGWTLKYFKEKNWDVLGIDLSDYGVRNHNPELSDFVIKGDLEVLLAELQDKKEYFDLILTDNVIEHVGDPLNVIQLLHSLTEPGGLLLIEVPNDFSDIQKHLFNTGKVSRPYWVSPPDHLSYFDKDGLNALCEKVGWKTLMNMTDFPIEMFLFNQQSNYVENNKVGKPCHLARIELENIFHSKGVEEANRFYEAAANLGLGRVITGIYQRSKGA